MNTPSFHIARTCLLALLLGLAATPARADDKTDAAALRSYHAGNGLLQKGLCDLAEAEYRRFLSEHGDHEKAPTARYGLAVCLFRTQRHEAAMAELEQLVTRDDFAFTAEVLMMLSQCRMARSQWPEAAESFEQFIRGHAGHKLAPEAAVQRIEALYRAGKAGGAASAGAEFLDSHSDGSARERALFFSGLAEESLGHPKQAAERFSTLMGAFPKSAFAERATLSLAHCAQSLGRLDDAEKHYRGAIERKDATLRDHALFGLAALLLADGKPQEAGPLLDQLLKEFPGSAMAPEAKLARARAWFDEGRFEEALAAFIALGEPKDAPKDQAEYWSAKCEIRLKQPDAAAKRLKSAIKRFRRSDLLGDMRYDLAVAQVRAGQDKAAAETLEEFLSDSPPERLSADALQLLATTLHRLGEYEKSGRRCAEHMEQFAASPAAAGVAFVAAENVFLTARYEPAADAYKSFLKKYPADDRAEAARLRLGLALHRLGRMEEAEPVLAGVANKAGGDEQFRSALHCLGDMAFARHEWKIAAGRFKSYLTAATVPPLADDSLLKLGICLQREGAGPESIESFDRLIREFPDSPHRPQALFEGGQALLAADRLEEARKLFEDVIASAADSRFAPYARNHLGIIAEKRGDHAGAAELFAGAAKGAPAGLKLDAALQRGQSLMAAGDYAAAAKALESLIESGGLDDREMQARGRLAICLARQDQCEDALGAIEKIKSDGLAPELRAAIDYERAWCLRKLDRPDEAANVYQRLIDQAGGASSAAHAILELAAIEMDRKQFDKAAKLIERIRAAAEGGLSPDMAEQTAYRLGVCQYERGDFTAAAKTLDGFLRDFPRSKLADTAALCCGEAFFKAGDHARAAEHLRRVVEAEGSDASTGAALLHLGESQARLQHWVKSEETFARYFELLPDAEGWYQAAFGIGWARENQRRYDEAIRSYLDVVNHHEGPTAARAQFQIGQCLFAKKRYDDAVRELLKVDILYAYPQWSAAALYEAGRCFEALAKTGEARQQFKTVVEKHAGTNWAKLASQRLSEMKTAATPGHEEG